jgi:hypothetical protein
VRLVGYEDPLFLVFEDDSVLYDGEAYSDFSCSEMHVIRKFMLEVGGQVEPFDVRNTVEYKMGELT